MFGQIFGFLGSSIGQAFGGGILSTIGRFVGRTFGDYLEHLNDEPEETHHFRNIKDSFYAQLAVYGQPIPLIFGSAKLNGKIIWANQIEEAENSTTTKKYFPNFEQVKSVNTVTECEYYLSFAVCICEGEIIELNRIWANDELLSPGKYNFRLYHGSETQMPDPLIEKLLGYGKTPAFRGLSYVVFERLPLENFNNSIPNFSFEITRRANIPKKIYQGVEGLVNSINMIPGSGEFVYDTIVQYKSIKTYYGGEVSKTAINSHNYHNIADSVYSLNQLQTICPNIKWVAPVVCWFADNLDINFCSIKPAIEFNDPLTSYSEEWRVGKYSRHNAKLVSRDSNNNPNYGGTVNDASIVRYLQELKRRNLKVMFYPMFFMDVSGKPWRGHVTGSADSVSDFFNKIDGYNNFILHYAKLVKDHIDAFIIGSELIGITSIKDIENNFPAVEELTKLAKSVKEIVRDKVLVSYAADWSEYHHTSGGWYNLDPLFASEYIDFVGIDAYFPITRTVDSHIKEDEIKKGLESGEGYEFYIDWEGNKQPLSAAYAWKNIKYWWENQHYNPDGKATVWQPKMKKIWFTEFGFPSIDKSTNQPNVFFDPLCRDGGVPKYSSGATDFSLQRLAIRSFIEYWNKEEYIEEMFLWTWDARPYPAWPHSNIWRDKYLWEKGHWVNGKFRSCSLASILLELSYRCDIKLERIDISTLDESVEGLMINKLITYMDVINMLRILYFFDVIAVEDFIKFIKRGSFPTQNLTSEILIKLSDNSYLEQEEITKENIISKLGLHFIDGYNDYKNGYRYINNEQSSNMPTTQIKIPIILSNIEAERIGQLILKNAAWENKILKFVIPANFLGITPGDFIILNYLNCEYQIRIISIKLLPLTLNIIGIIDEKTIYSMPVINNVQEIEYAREEEIKCVILDLPFNLNNNNEACLAVYMESANSHYLYASVEANNYSKIANLINRTSIGNLVSFEDEASKLVVSCKNFENLVIEGWNSVICGSEIIKFQKWQKISEDLYQLSEMIRGLYSTSSETHQIGEYFIFLEKNVNLISVSQELRDKDVYFKVGNLEPWKIQFRRVANATNLL